MKRIGIVLLALIFITGCSHVEKIDEQVTTTKFNFSCLDGTPVLTASPIEIDYIQSKKHTISDMVSVTIHPEILRKEIRNNEKEDFLNENPNYKSISTNYVAKRINGQRLINEFCDQANTTEADVFVALNIENVLYERSETTLPDSVADNNSDSIVAYSVEMGATGIKFVE